MNAPAEKLVADVKILTADVEELMRATAAQSGEKIAAARARLEVALADARESAVLHGRAAVESTDRYVRENSWTAVGIAAGVGLLLGLLIGRR